MLELPPHVRRVVAKGREYFYFQRGRDTPLEGARTPLPAIRIASNSGRPIVSR